MSILRATAMCLKCVSYFFLFLFVVVSISTCSASDRIDESTSSSISINWDASKDPEQDYKPNKGYESRDDKYNPKCGYSEYCPSTDKD